MKTLPLWLLSFYSHSSCYIIISLIFSAAQTGDNVDNRRQQEKLDILIASRAGHFNCQWSQGQPLFSISSQIMLRLRPKDLISTPFHEQSSSPQSHPFLCSTALPLHTPPPYQKYPSGTSPTQSTSPLPNCGSHPQSLSRAPHIAACSTHSGREVLVTLLRNQPITNNRLLKFCCPGNQIPKCQNNQVHPVLCQIHPLLISFLLLSSIWVSPLLACLKQSPAKTLELLYLTLPKTWVHTYFLTTNPDSNDLQLYDLAPRYEISPFSCLLPLQSLIFHSLLFISAIFQVLLH